MIKTFKWLWNKAERYGRDKVLSELSAMRGYHNMKAETAFLKAKYEPTEPKDRDDMFLRPRLTPNEHSAISSALSEFLSSQYKADQQIQRGKPHGR